MPLVYWQQQLIQIEQNDIRAPTIEISENSFLFHQVVGLLPLSSLTVLPGRLDQGLNVALTPSLLSRRTGRRRLLQIVLRGTGMRCLHSSMVSLLTMLIKVTLGVVGNNGMQLVATLTRGLEQMLCQ